MKAIVIGRHKLTGKEGVSELARQENINFPAYSDDVVKVIKPLIEEANKEGAVLLFQMMPAQLSVAINKCQGYSLKGYAPPRVGAIVNTPSERPSGVSKEFNGDDPYSLASGEEAVKFANPRAKVKSVPSGFIVTVDPPLRFEFSHIEWF